MTESEDWEMRLRLFHLGSCPDASLWAEVSLGQVPDREAEELLAHAAECEKCGAILQSASLACEDKPTQEELNVIAALRSSEDKWQTRLAGELSVLATPNSRTERASWKLSFRRIVVPLSIASALAVFVGALWIYRSRNSLDHLIASSYNHERLTELRIPGVDPVPMYSPLRTGNLTEQTLESQEARIEIEKALSKDGSNAHWHQMLGRVDVVDMQPESALAEFQLAEIRDPHLPRIDFDLGTAYFELGERPGGDPSNFGHAAERFSRFLESEKGPVGEALYDRALCWQKLGISELAQKDLQKTLAVERNPAWRETIRRKLDSEFNAGHSVNLGLEPSAPPASGDDYETRLSGIVEKQLTSPASELHKSVRETANLGKAHRDSWTHDWLLATRTKRSKSGDEALSAAVLANLQGNASSGHQKALLAEDSYRIAGNRPGLLRSEAEEIYALRRSGQARECLQRLLKVTSDEELHNYSWLSADLILEKSACLGQLGQFDSSMHEAENALQIADSADLPLISLRARGFIADSVALEL